MKPKYSALIITSQSFYINSDGTVMDMQPQPTSEQALLDSFLPESQRKYAYTTLYKNLGEVTGNSVREICENLTGKALLPYDVILYFTRKAGKPFTSQPVGKTWL